MHILWDVCEYVSASGRRPFSDWYLKLKDSKGKNLVLLRLRRFQLGNFGDCEFISDGVFESRIHYGPGYRFYFGRYKEHLIVVLSGGDKGSQTKDIKKSLIYWIDVKRRQREAISKFQAGAH